MKCQFFPTNKIKREFPYSFSFPDISESLKESIKRNGIITPLYIEEDTHTIICGKRRYLISVELGIETVPVIFIPPGKDNLCRFLENVEVTLTERELNIVEKSNIVAKLITHFGVTKKEVKDKYLQLLKLHPLDKYIELCTWITGLSPQIQLYIIHRRIMLDTLEIAFNLGKDGEKILQFLARTAFGNNKCKEFLNLFRDLSKKQKISFQELLQEEEIRAMINDSKMPFYGKGIFLLAYMRKRRYPVMEEVRGKLERIVRQMNIRPPLILDKSSLLQLEKHYIDLKLKLGKENDIDKAIEGLKQLQESDELKKLLTYLKDFE